MKVKVINPLDSAINVDIDGQEYHLEAKGELVIEEAHAEYWKNKLHNFLIVEAADKEAAEEVAEKVEEVVEKSEVTEEEPQVEKVVAKKTTKTTKK